MKGARRKAISPWVFVPIGFFTIIAFVGVIGVSNSSNGNVARWGPAAEWFAGWAAAVTLVIVLAALLHELNESRQRRDAERTAAARRVSVWCQQVLDVQPWSVPDAAGVMHRVPVPIVVLSWRNDDAQPVFRAVVYLVDPDGTERGVSLGTIPAGTPEGGQYELILAEPGVLPDLGDVPVGLEFVDEYGQCWRRRSGFELDALPRESPRRPPMRRVEDLWEHRDHAQPGP